MSRLRRNDYLVGPVGALANVRQGVKRTLMLSGMFLMTACAHPNPDGMTTEDLWGEHCRDAGVNGRLNPDVTVEHWDPDATTAGHRGVRDGSEAPPRGC